MKVVDYYFSPASPWSFLGHERLARIAQDAGAKVRVRPVDYGVIFPQSGGLPLGKRAPQRQAYRLMELARWKNRLGVPIVIQPRYFPTDANPAAKFIIAAEPLGEQAQMTLAGAIMAALWIEDRNIAERATLDAIASKLQIDASALTPGERVAAEKYERYTRDALARGVFGAPTYAIGEELFWGQDRLDFVAQALSHA